MRSQLYLKTLAELYSAILARMTDSGNELSGQASYYAAINEAIEMWGKRVTLPHVYELPGGLAAGVYAYPLPSHINPPFTLQINSGSTWHDVAGYEVEPLPSGGFQLRLPFSPYTDSGRIIYWSENGPLITSAIELGTNITIDDTEASVTVIGGPPAGQAGFFKVGNEWLGYNGVTFETPAIYGIHNLEHGLAASWAHNHLSGDSVEWGVGVDDPRLWSQLYDYVTAFIHGVQMHKGTTEDISRHEKLMSYYQQKADGFWRTQGYVGQRKGQGQLSPRSVGP